MCFSISNNDNNKKLVIARLFFGLETDEKLNLDLEKSIKHKSDIVEYTRKFYLEFQIGVLTEKYLKYNCMNGIETSCKLLSLEKKSLLYFTKSSNSLISMQ